MKKIYLSLMACAVLFTGCDLLNTDPYDQFTKSNFFTSETNVEMFANYFYNEFTGYGQGTGYGQFYFQLLNDNQATTGLSTWSYTQVPATISTWGNCYTEIRRANTMIEETPKIDMSQDKIDHWVGVARMYRAWQHYCLVRAFGDCYYVDKVLSDGDQDVLFGKRQDRDMVMDKVLEDINYAVEHINQDGNSRTAYNVWVAQAIKAEICLYEGTFCKYRTEAENGKAANADRAKKFLGEAKTACEAIINSNQFELSDGIAGYRANYNSLDLAGNKEMIMYKKYVLGLMNHCTIDYCCGSTQTNGISKAAFDSYLFIDGKPLASTGKDKSDHAVVMKNPQGDTIMNIAAALAVRDPRLSQHVDSTLRYVGHGEVRYKYEEAGKNAAENTSSTGYGVLKFDRDNGITPTNRQSTTGGETDAPIFWLAEILLNHAEACAELGGENDAAAEASINKLRARVGMPDLTLNNDPANNMEVSDLIWEVRRERRVEMMYDKNDRYWSLIRWHQLDKLDTEKYPDQAKGAWIDVNNFDGVGDLVAAGRIGADGYLDCHNGQPDRKFEAKHYLNPIPSGEATLNPEIGQNLGW